MRVERPVPWICGRVLRTGANPAGRVDSPWATPRRCPPPDHTFAPLAHELHSTKNLLFCEEEDEDRSIWQHMMDSRITLNLAANLSKDWGPPLYHVSRLPQGCMWTTLESLISPAIHGGLKSARGAPGHPWPRAAHTTLSRVVHTHPRYGSGDSQHTTFARGVCTRPRNGSGVVNGQMPVGQ